MNSYKTFVVGAVLSLSLSSHSALAAGSSDATETPTCRTGLVYDKETKKCIPADKKTQSDASLLNNAKALAYAQRYDEAKLLLDRMQDTNDTEVQTYLGFVTRKLGDAETAMGHYALALTLDPDNTLARSYMGRAMILAGDRRGAQIQLEEIAMRDGTSGRAYDELAMALLAKSLNSSVQSY